MKLIEINPFDKKSEKKFLKLPLKIYKDDKNYVLPLYKEIKKIFEPKENPCFNFGEAKRWILEDEKGETIGRVAAFYDKRITLAGNEQATGGMGFFECIDNKEAAFVLFNQCKDWLLEKGMEARNFNEPIQRTRYSSGYYFL
jgi:hypothetical protein